MSLAELSPSLFTNSILFVQNNYLFLYRSCGEKYVSLPSVVMNDNQPHPVQCSGYMAGNKTLHQSPHVLYPAMMPLLSWPGVFSTF